MQLHQKFIISAKNNGKKLAVIDKSTQQNVTYNKALIASLLLSSKFKEYSEHYIGVMLPNSAGAVLATVAILMSGKVPVMINYSTGAERNALFAQNKCSFKTIITSSALLEKIGAPKVEGMIFLEELMKEFTIVDKLKMALVAKMPVNYILKRVHQGSEEESAVVLFTSGSEKEPKAVELTHKNIISNIESFTAYADIREDDKLLAILVFFHVFGITVNLWVTLYNGMTMITYANPLDFATVCSIAREERPTVMVGTPSFYWGYLNRSQPGDFSSVRLMVAGADKTPDALRERYLKEHGVTLLEGYGATETSPVVSVNTLEYNRPGSIGKPIPGVEVKIVHLESEEECPVGEIGMIWIKGDSVMKGYLGDPHLTEEVLKNGWYNSGDMGYLDEDGYLWHSGRYKRFVKVGGEMVSLVKVEDTLEKYLPAGVSCCVVEVSDELKGASIVATVNIEVNKSEILRQMAKDLPNIALPKHFITIEELPMMGSGKIDFRSVTMIVEEMMNSEAGAPV